MFSGINLPFGVAAMLDTAINFLAIYKEYIILTLACIVIYIFINPIMNMMNYAVDRTVGGVIKKGVNAHYDRKYGKGDGL